MLENRKQMQLICEESFIRNCYRVPYYYTQIDPNIQEKHEKLIAIKRREPQHKLLEPFIVQDLNLFPNPVMAPIMIEEVYIKDETVPPNEVARLTISDMSRQIVPPKGFHVIFLVHGF